MRKLIFILLGLSFSTLPPVAAVLLYFPVWQTMGSEYVFCGFTLFLLVLCALPLVKYLRQLLRSPSVTLMWLISFALFFLLGKIADQMTVICFVGFGGNFIGSVFFKLAGGVENEKQP